MEFLESIEIRHISQIPISDDIILLFQRSSLIFK